MKIKKDTMPQESGFYFAKSKTSKVWQVLVNVIGFAPFLSIETVNTIFKESDVTILTDLRELVWSEAIDMEDADEIWHGYVITPEAKKEVIALIKEGSKLGAVKALKYSTKNPDDDFAPCLGLKEAKEYVDRLCDELKNKAVFVAS